MRLLQVVRRKAAKGLVQCSTDRTGVEQFGEVVEDEVLPCNVVGYALGKGTMGE